MIELIHPLIAAPVLPASILLGLMIFWSLFTIFIGAGIDMQGNWHPFHSLGHGDVHSGFFHSIFDHLGETLGSVVLTPTRWLNLQSIPWMLWMGVFSITWWSCSLVWWLALDEWLIPQPGRIVNSMLILRNLACGLPLTKVLTQPMQGWFSDEDQLDSKSLIGKEAEICSYEATPEFGQAKYRTGSAPLLLNVRTDGPHLGKGSKVWIVYYDPKKRVYQVSPTTTDTLHPIPNGKTT